MKKDLNSLLSESAHLKTSMINKIISNVPDVTVITDGIVDMDLYYNASPKILWILKEAYCDGANGTGGGWSLSELLSSDDFYCNMDHSRATWHPIIYACHCIFNNYVKWEDPSVDYIRDNPKMVDVLKKIAVINIKKLPGFTNTDFNIIAEEYEKHKDIILAQIEAFEPDVIIGVGAYSSTTLHLLKNDLKLPEFNVNGSVQFCKNKSQLFIAAYHPAQTIITRQNYVNDIVQSVKEYL